MKKSVLLFFSVSFLLYVNALAGNGNSTIRVKVYDDNTGEPLIGANVVIAGTTQGNVTDLEGSASIPNLSPGDYAIQVSYVSYQTKTVEDAHVGDGEVKVLDVRLKEESIGLDAVVVTAKALKDSENALLTLQKKSPKTFDAITSDQFSKNGDSDAASALSRVTGVTVTSGKYVYVRGLGDRYSKSVLNGSEIPSLDPKQEFRSTRPFSFQSDRQYHSLQNLHARPHRGLFRWFGGHQHQGFSRPVQYAVITQRRL